MIYVTILISLLLGLALLYFSSEVVVEKLVLLARYLGVSAFNIGFIVSSIGSDLPEIVNGILSSFLGHGDIAIGNSIGSSNAQLLLILGLIPFFCTFCRLIPRPFMIVGASEVIVLVLAVVLAVDGLVSRLDALILTFAWFLSIWVMRRFGGERIAVEESADYKIESIRKGWTALGLLLGFVAMAIGSYLVVESVVLISDIFGISQYFVSFFLLSIGTSLPELVVSVSSIRKRYYELAVGNIVGSNIVDLSLAISFAAFISPMVVRSREILFTGSYAIVTHTLVIGLLTYRGINDKRSGAVLLLLYLSTWLIPLIFF
ncbi:hypothetical protein GF319_02805 [Candidatus Bathyarchaeota archaeon]|nr:hypothetical protein [Candidatus Bathyarchaeota archaeon]